MKTKTILKTVAFIIGWLLAFQIIDVTMFLMNQPSSLSFTFGALASFATLGAMVYSGYKLGGMAAQLLSEYKESKNKQDKKQ